MSYLPGKSVRILHLSALLLARCWRVTRNSAAQPASARGVVHAGQGADDRFRADGRGKRVADGEHEVHAGPRPRSGGFTLQFSDGQGKQENQIAAVAEFHRQGVDVIVIAPVVETGWQPVFAGGEDGEHSGD